MGKEPNLSIPAMTMVPSASHSAMSNYDASAPAEDDMGEHNKEFQEEKVMEEEEENVPTVEEPKGEVIEFLRSIRDIGDDANYYYYKFIEHGFDSKEVILSMNNQDLKRIGITNIVHMRRVLMKIEEEIKKNKDNITLGSDLPSNEHSEVMKENGNTVGWDLDHDLNAGSEVEGDDGVMEDPEQPGKETHRYE